MKYSRPAPLLAILAVTVTALSGEVAAAQQSAPRTDLRTQALVASFNKSKHVSKEKRGVRKEKYLEVRSEAVAKANPADYSGAYDTQGLGFTLQILVDRSGKVEGTGSEPLNDDATISRSFTLREGQVAGALITARKVYANGSSEPFEGVFINRTTFESPTDKGYTRFGLGVLTNGVRVAGQTLERVFYELKE